MKNPCKWGLMYLLIILLISCVSPNSVSVLAREPSIDYFKVDPNEIYYGILCQLSWYVTNAESVSINHGISAVEAIGVKWVYPEKTITYRLTARNSFAEITAECRIVVLDDLVIKK